MNDAQPDRATVVEKWPRRMPEYAERTFTFAEYYELGVRERWWEGRRPFFLRGEAWEQGRMSPVHACLICVAGDVLRPLFGDGCYFRTQGCFESAPDTYVRADFSVVTGAIGDYHQRFPTTARLAGEIADTTLFFDTTTKAELYATAGVLDYWVLDVNQRELHVFRDPQPVADNVFAYRWSQTFPESDSITPLAAPNSPIRVADLLP